MLVTMESPKLVGSPQVAGSPQAGNPWGRPMGSPEAHGVVVTHDVAGRRSPMGWLQILWPPPPDPPTSMPVSLNRPPAHNPSVSLSDDPTPVEATCGEGTNIGQRPVWANRTPASRPQQPSSAVLLWGGGGGGFFVKRHTQTNTTSRTPARASNRRQRRWACCSEAQTTSANRGGLERCWP